MYNAPSYGLALLAQGKSLPLMSSLLMYSKQCTVFNFLYEISRKGLYVF